MVDIFYGKYVIGKATSKISGGELLSADNIIGDVYDIVCEYNNGIYITYARNRFNKKPCYFDEDVSRETYILKNKGFRLFAILTLVGFTYSDDEENSNYWAEFALIGFKESDNDIFLPFVEAFTNEIDKGVRPTLDFSNENIKEIQDGNYSVLNSKQPLPKKEKGTVFMKTHRKISEKFIEMGRKKKLGCYLVSILFLFVIVIVVFLIIKMIIGF